MWIDTHCHLDAAEFAADRAAVLAAAREAGVTTIVVPAIEVGNFAAVRALAAEPGVAAAYGIHPLYTPRATDGDLAELRCWLRDARPVAVGEIGLDGYVPGVDFARQEVFFVEQLKLARDFDLPVLLHLRRAQDIVLKHLRRVFGRNGGGRGGIAHAFSGSRQQADEFLKLGFKLGFGGSATYAGSTRIRRLAAELPLDAIVLETDAPDIAPQWLAGRRNTPDELPRIGRVIAELRGIPVAALAATTSANARSALAYAR